MSDFYKWWTEHIKGNYITNEEFDSIVVNVNFNISKNEML